MIYLVGKFRVPLYAHRTISHFYKKKSMTQTIKINQLLLVGVLLLLGNVLFAQDVFINEVRYKGAQADRGVEVVGPKGTDMTQFILYVYDESGTEVKTMPLTGTLGDEGGGYDAIWYPVAELSDGGGSTYLENNVKGIDHFVSFENPTAPTTAPALGLPLNNIGLQSALTPAITLQLIGTGTLYPDFTWVTQAATKDFINTSQSFTALPVQLTTFQASIKESQVELYWNTASEVNNKEFIVERSMDGEQFERIGVIAGAGTSSKPKDYWYVDEFPRTGINYYRLQQVDKDGRTEYSDVIIAELTVSNIALLMPNPVTQGHEIQIFSSLTSDITIQLIDTNGGVVIAKEFNGMATINTSTLERGMYFYRIISNGQMVDSGKIMIVR